MYVTKTTAGKVFVNGVSVIKSNIECTNGKNKQLEAEELKRNNSQAQLQAIRNQVNPHFLFNNLNVLS